MFTRTKNKNNELGFCDSSPAHQMNIIYLKQQIELAIKNKKFLKIDYVGKDLKVTRDRVIEPLNLLTPNKVHGDWSVIANCFLRNDTRQFQLGGIQKLEVIEPDERQQA